jgi:hypothetical protein
LSICPHATTRESVIKFNWYMILGCFTKICRHILILVKPETVTGISNEHQHSFLIASRLKLAKYLVQRIFSNRVWRETHRSYFQAKGLSTNSSGTVGLILTNYFTGAPCSPHRLFYAPHKENQKAAFTNWKSRCSIAIQSLCCETHIACSLILPCLSVKKLSYSR